MFAIWSSSRPPIILNGYFDTWDSFDSTPGVESMHFLLLRRLAVMCAALLCSGMKGHQRYYWA